LWRSIRVCVERREEAARLPIAAVWFAGKDRFAANMGELYARLPKKSSRLRFAVLYVETVSAGDSGARAANRRFAEMIGRHRDGIAACCRPENKISLGFVEGLNNKIRVIQRRAYGSRDGQYLRLKSLTCTAAALTRLGI
jgi:hypothetical protein